MLIPIRDENPTSRTAVVASPSSNALELCSVPGNLDYLVVGRDAKINW